jgi:DNA gyrase/topoisomerase IV subunit A
MIRESDIQWWILEARKHPESGPDIIQELAKRLVELDAENEQLRAELLRIRQRTPATGAAPRIDALQHKVETLQSLLETQASGEPSVVLLSDRLQAMRVPTSQVHELAQQDRPVLSPRAALSLYRVVQAGMGDELLMLTSQGRAFRRLLADIPLVDDKGRWPVPLEDVIESGERLAAVTTTSAPPRLWTIVTQRGYVERFVRAGIEINIADREPVLRNVARHDEPVAITEGDRGDLVLVTQWGQAVRFAQQAIETQGSRALDLEPDDRVVGALTMPGDSMPGASGAMLLVTASGYGMRRESAHLPARSRPGGAGKALIQARDVLAILMPPPGHSQTQLLFVTYTGKLALEPIANIPMHERLGKGTLVHDLAHDPAAAVALLD